MLIVLGKTLDVETKEFNFGNLNCVVLGEEGRGRKEIILPTPNNLDLKSISGVNYNLSLGLSKNGKLRINQGNTDFHIIVSSEGGYTRRGNGKSFILVPQKEAFSVVDYAYGADGAAGRIGNWYDIILKVNSFNFPLVIRNVKSGGNPSTIYLIMKNNVGEVKVFNAQEGDIINMFDLLVSEIPFSLDNNFNFNPEEWIRLT
jgi:hypothetical protein